MPKQVRASTHTGDHLVSVASRESTIQPHSYSRSSLLEADIVKVCEDLIMSKCLRIAIVYILK